MARVSSTLTIRTKETISTEVVSFFCMGGGKNQYIAKIDKIKDMKLKGIFFLLGMLAAVLFVSCGKATSDTDETDEVSYETWTVASERIEMDEYLCFWIKRNGNPDWMLCYDSIKGFDYREGYEYVVEVKIIPVTNPPADASSAQYVLEKIISIEEKESDTPQLNLNFAAKQ